MEAGKLNAAERVLGGKQLIVGRSGPVDSRYRDYRVR